HLTVICSKSTYKKNALITLSQLLVHLCLARALVAGLLLANFVACAGKGVCVMCAAPGKGMKGNGRKGIIGNGIAALCLRFLSSFLCGNCCNCCCCVT